MGFDLDKVRAIAERVAADSGLEVVEIELRGGGKSRMLRVFLDKADGLTHEDCANYSREIGTILDVEDAMPGGSYLLEVSSPGLDRKLSKPADFERFQGSLLKLTTREPISGNRHFEGRLQKFENGTLTIDMDAVRRKKKKKLVREDPAGSVDIPFVNVETANLVPEI